MDGFLEIWGIRGSWTREEIIKFCNNNRAVNSSESDYLLVNFQK